MRKYLDHPIIARVTFLLVSTTIILMMIAYITATDNENNETKALSLETTIEVVNTDEVDESADIEVASEVDPTPINEIPANVEVTTEEALSGNTVDYFSIIVDDVEKLKAADVDTVVKYFGTSDVFTPEVIADRVSATNVNLINYEFMSDGYVRANLHICTIDYNVMNNDFNAILTEKQTEYDNAVAEGKTPEVGYLEATKKQIATNLIEGKYEVCYNIPVTIDTDNNIVIAESFKQAITGGWYTGVGVTLTAADCVVE